MDILHGNFRLLFGNSMVVIQTLFTNLTPLCHICWRVCSPTVIYDWFPVILGRLWRVPHVGQKMLTLSGKCLLFPEHSYSFRSLPVLALCLRINGLFAWISLDCFVVDFFISLHDISSSDKDNDIPSLYWIPKLYIIPNNDIRTLYMLEMVSIKCGFWNLSMSYYNSRNLRLYPRFLPSKYLIVLRFMQ